MQQLLQCVGHIYGRALIHVTLQRNLLVSSRWCRLGMDIKSGRSVGFMTLPVEREGSPVLSRDVHVAVIGAGVAGCVCASTLAEAGISVIVFEKGRGAGGRMSQRRALAKDGQELFFDHGAQYFTSSKYLAVQQLFDKWEASGLIAKWDGRFGLLDFHTKEFKEDPIGGVTRYVGVPGMNAMCTATSMQPGVRMAFNTTVASLIWSDEQGGCWNLKDKDGKHLGQYVAVIVADKSLASPTFTVQTGLPPPLEFAGVPDLYRKMSDVRAVACFTVMLAFDKPLGWELFDKLTIVKSNLLAGAVCVSRKPGRKVIEGCEYWVLHSTFEFAEEVISKAGLENPLDEMLADVADRLYGEFKDVITNDLPVPSYIRAHRWGSAFPIAAIAAEEEECVFQVDKRIVACGDYCLGPRIECAVASALSASHKILSWLKMMQ